MTTESSEAAQ